MSTDECRPGSYHLPRTSYGALLTARCRHRQSLQVPGRKEVIGAMKSLTQRAKALAFMPKLCYLVTQTAEEDHIPKETI